jgi:integrase
MRPGENAGLQWADIDWNSKRAIIRRSIDFENGTTDGKNGKIVETKTKKIRTIDLSDELIAALKQHRASQREYWLRKGQPMPVWLFPNEVGGWMCMDALRDRAFKRVLSKAGLAGRDLYDMRHSFCSQLLQRGAQPAYVARQAGHSLKVLLDIYAHYLPDTSDREHLNELPGRCTLSAPASDHSVVSV